ncbi:MAG: hypothetical protein QOE92_2081, partial [Chloroflexota bacterium]|nr:hypothetical protein [Chloroflexota bacterium]
MSWDNGGMLFEGGAYISPDRRWRWDGAAWIPNLSQINWQWPGARAARPADIAVVVSVAIVSVLFDLAVRSWTLGLASTMCAVAVAVSLVATRRVRNRWALGAIALAGVFASCWSVRASAWVLVPDLLAVVLLLALAAWLATSGSLLDFRTSQLLRLAGFSLVHVLSAVSFVSRPLVERWRVGSPRRRKDLVSTVRGLAIALPVVGVVGILLASADPVFASFFNINVDAGDIALHALLLAVGVVVAGALLRAASTDHPDQAPRQWHGGTAEALVVMALLDGLFVVFAVAQGVAATQAGQATIQAAGVTYSDYARSGFFQLLWVAGITLVVLMTVRAVVRPDGARQRAAYVGLAELGVVLVLVIIGVASQRLSLYEDAYGFTMLRLYSHAFALFAGLVFVVVGVAFARPPRRNWLFAAVGGISLLMVLG